MPLTITPYAGQGWTDNSEPDLSAETLNAVDAGITANSNAINAIANAVVSQIVNDPNKIASMAALYAVNSNLAAMRTPILLGKITAVGSISINASLYREIALYIKTSAGGFLPPVIIHTNLLSASPLRVHPTMFYGVSNYLSTTVDISLTAINYVSSSASESSFASLDAWGIK
ncbi:hypothetical protein [Lacrimispora sp.]|uniref:hypothetical protein n=1 Tax=Lacrimispora sp. TaxID=2719234 RepID=UPI0028B1C2DB|nr:hypothetical protein [Lacrimispora sp.]